MKHRQAQAELPSGSGVFGGFRDDEIHFVAFKRGGMVDIEHDELEQVGRIVSRLQVRVLNGEHGLHHESVSDRSAGNGFVALDEGARHLKRDRIGARLGEGPVQVTSPPECTFTKSLVEMPSRVLKSGLGFPNVSKSYEKKSPGPVTFLSVTVT